MRWIWVRHGETNENKAGRYLGHSDVLLNDLGQKQARQLADWLEGQTVHRLFTSDLRRCVDTAKVIGQRVGLAPIPFPELRELNFGAWEAKTYHELMWTDKEKAQQWYNNPFSIAPPGGETLNQLGQRLDIRLGWIMDSMRIGECAVIVSHGGPIRWFQSKWMEGDAMRFWMVKGAAHGTCFIAEWNGSAWEAAPLREV